MLTSSATLKSIAAQRTCRREGKWVTQVQSAKCKILFPSSGPFLFSRTPNFSPQLYFSLPPLNPPPYNNLPVVSYSPHTPPKRKASELGRGISPFFLALLPRSLLILLLRRLVLAKFPPPSCGLYSLRGSPPPFVAFVLCVLRSCGSFSLCLGWLSILLRTASWTANFAARTSFASFSPRSQGQTAPLDFVPYLAATLY